LALMRKLGLDRPRPVHRTPAAASSFAAMQEKRIRDLGRKYGPEEFAATAYALFLRYHPGFKCCYCDAEPPLLERRIDHFVPLAGGGMHAVGNLLPACRPCNRLKGFKYYDVRPEVAPHLAPMAWARSWEVSKAPPPEVEPPRPERKVVWYRGVKRKPGRPKKEVRAESDGLDDLCAPAPQNFAPHFLSEDEWFEWWIARAPKKNRR
jgi:5-methylcytosine-specific restriction endonuclease McrA